MPSRKVNYAKHLVINYEYRIITKFFDTTDITKDFIRGDVSVIQDKAW